MFKPSRLSLSCALSVILFATAGCKWPGKPAIVTVVMEMCETPVALPDIPLSLTCTRNDKGKAVIFSATGPGCQPWALFWDVERDPHDPPTPAADGTDLAAGIQLYLPAAKLIGDERAARKFDLSGVDHFELNLEDLQGDKSGPGLPFVGVLYFQAMSYVGNLSNPESLSDVKLSHVCEVTVP